MKPCSLVNLYRHLKEQGRTLKEAVSFSGTLLMMYQSNRGVTLKMEALYSDETSVTMYHCTRRDVPGDSSLHVHGYMDLRNLVCLLEQHQCELWCRR
jgi:hypothetical protein